LRIFEAALEHDAADVGRLLREPSNRHILLEWPPP
jgi:hypothetical protein